MLSLLRSTRTTAFSRKILGNAPQLRLRGSAGGRRGMASNSHSHATSSDTPWIVGSAALFGPALIYLLGPGSSSIVTGHGDPSKDPHPSGHGAAPAPLMEKAVPRREESTTNPETEKEESNQEARQPETEKQPSELSKEAPSPNEESGEGGEGEENSEVSETTAPEEPSETDKHDNNNTDKSESEGGTKKDEPSSTKTEEDNSKV